MYANPSTIKKGNANTNQRKAGLDILLISDRKDFKAWKGNKDKAGYYIMIKGVPSPRTHNLLVVTYMPNSDIKLHKARLCLLQGEID